MLRTDSEQPNRDSALFGGTARLPTSLGGGSTVLSIEVEVDVRSRSVLAVHVSPDLPGLENLLVSAMVGRAAGDIPGTGILTIKARYFSPFRNAANAALLHAWEAFVQFEKKVPAEIASARPA